MPLLLIVVFTFAAVTGLSFAAYQAFTAESPVARRLRELGAESPPVGVRRDERKKGPGLVGVTKRVLAILGQYSIGGSEISLTQTLSVAGMRSTTATVSFLGVRTVLSLGPALMVLVPRVSDGQPLGKSLLLAGGAWFAGHLVTNLWLKSRARKRARAIMNALPDTLDLMIICLEAGLGLNATIARVGDERSNLDDALGREFAIVSAELRAGRSREDSLRSLGDRNGVEDLKTLAGLVIQSDRLGASMAKTLRAHADLLRTKRRQRAEEAARKLPIKMLFPLAVFILPPLFTVTVGPAVLQIMTVMGSIGKR